MTKFIVTLREGSMCREAGLSVETFGPEAHVTCAPHELDTFWGLRLRFLRENRSVNA